MAEPELGRPRRSLRSGALLLNDQIAVQDEMLFVVLRRRVLVDDGVSVVVRGDALHHRASPPPGHAEQLAHREPDAHSLFCYAASGEDSGGLGTQKVRVARAMSEALREETQRALVDAAVAATVVLYFPSRSSSRVGANPRWIAGGDSLVPRSSSTAAVFDLRFLTRGFSPEAASDEALGGRSSSRAGSYVIRLLVEVKRKLPVFLSSPPPPRPCILAIPLSSLLSLVSFFEVRLLRLAVGDDRAAPPSGRSFLALMVLSSRWNGRCRWCRCDHTPSDGREARRCSAFPGKRCPSCRPRRCLRKTGPRTRTATLS
mmetsp:Transcript_49117/g.104460  ORF Transcript_49117/g.104460 Transcript_49117/m.104460 type:complete len:315 (-) Transcript_49117:476-1420(-)